MREEKGTRLSLPLPISSFPSLEDLCTPRGGRGEREKESPNGAHNYGGGGRRWCRTRGGDRHFPHTLRRPGGAHTHTVYLLALLSMISGYVVLIKTRQRLRENEVEVKYGE